jgi:hypothetical protein
MEMLKEHLKLKESMPLKEKQFPSRIFNNVFSSLCLPKKLGRILF